MKKFLLCLATALLALPQVAFADDASQSVNVGVDQLKSLEPTPGKLSRETYDGGFLTINLAFKKDAQVNRSANLFVTVKRDDNVIANVPASNTQLVQFDNIMFDVWLISFMRFPNYECKVGGHYEITIPEGFFLVGEDKTPNSEIILNYYLDYPTISIYPAESRECLDLQDFVITFGNAQSLEVNTDVEHGVLLFDLYGGSSDVSDDDEEIVPDGSGYTPEITINGNSALLHFPERITTQTTWVLEIPSGVFTLIDADGNTSPNSDLTYHYAIPKVGAGQPDIFPPAGPILEFPGVIELTLKGDETVSLVNNMGLNAIYAINEDGTRGEQIADYRAASKASNYYKDSKGQPTNLNKVFLINSLGEDARITPAPGYYQLVTSNGLYSNAKYVSVSSFTYQYEVVDGNYYEMEFTPKQDDAVKELKSIKVTFPNADELKITWATAWLSSSTTSYQFYPSAVADDPQSVIFTTDVPVTMPGKYRFSSDLKSVEVDGDLVGIVANYVVAEESGVGYLTDVVALPAHFDIFNAQGVVIKRNATIEELNALPSGIYIAGGKKIVNP